MSIINKAKKAVKNNPIIGNTIFDDNEYEELLKFTKTRSGNFLKNNTPIINEYHETIFLTLCKKTWSSGISLPACFIK